MKKTPYTLDLVLELNGEWHDKQRIAGIPDPNSGGTTVYLSPGVRVGCRPLLGLRVRRRAGDQPAQRRSVQARFSRPHRDRRAAELTPRFSPEWF